MKKYIKFIIVISLFVFLLVCLSFYAAAYIKGNNCIVHANKNIVKEQYIEYSNWISLSDYNELRIVDEAQINDTTYISLKTKPKFSIRAWNKIVIDYQIIAVIKDSDTWEEITNYNQRRAISFVFSDFKWMVDSVKKQ